MTPASESLEHPFFFLRHGETKWNASRRTQGQLETALSETGRAQALAAAKALRDQPIERIVASPLARVRDTVEPVAALHGLEVVYDPELRECGLGAKQGQPHGPWLEEYWTGAATPDGAEPYNAFAERIWGALRRAVDRPGVLVAAHGGIWRVVLGRVAVSPAFWMPNGLPVRATPQPGVWSVEALLPPPADLRSFTP